MAHLCNCAYDGNKMSLIVIDVEADGPIPYKYSMVSFGAVVVEEGLTRTFYGKVKPISNEWLPDALAVSGFSREEHEQFDEPSVVMQRFTNWLNMVGRSVMISDNPAFDWQFINYYMHTYTGANPLGFSARRIGDLYCGMVKDMSKNKEWKRKFRKTAHDHNPVNDSKGNAEALLAMKKLGLKGI